MIKWTSAGIIVLLLTFVAALGIVSASPSQQAGQSLTVQRSADRQSATASWTPIQGADNQLFLYFGKLLLGEKDATGLGFNFSYYGENLLTGDDGSLPLSGLDPAREYVYAVGKAELGEGGKWVYSDWAVAGLPAPGSAAMDREALVALYNATDGDNWRDNTKWLSDSPIGEWSGVTTDADGRVTEIELWLNKLNGQLPAELGNLARLQRLNFTLNTLSGGLPPELGQITALRELRLIGNKFSGEIPVQYGGLYNLEKLRLSVGNNYAGCVPAALQHVPVNDLSDLAIPLCS